ncbi:MAG TPA: helix-turn-helix transcriptional regulator [Nocardioidaceae bacterium]|nr:helix-turn-helix transcriptional regulator [Nocardioidaceae bacterium]
MPSWKNATRSTSGVLRPDEIQERTRLRREHAVSPELTPYVERYWTVRWDLEGAAAYRAEVLSDPAVNVSVEQGSHPRFGVVLPAALVHGVVTRRFSVDLSGTGAVAAVKFRPGGFTALAGVRADRNTVVRLTDQLALDPATVTAAVLREPDDGARASILDAALRPLAREPATAYLELLAILDRMRGVRSLVRVDQVAADSGVSVRALQRLFTTYVGVGAKAVLARYRLQDAVASIDAGEIEQLAELAIELGWFDQAHFSREFRGVVGTTPSAYLDRARSARARS